MRSLFVIPILLWVLLVLYADITEAHDAPAGWHYDSTCCNTIDCRQVNTNKKNKDGHSSGVIVEEVTGGYRISTTGEVIPWNSPKIRDSKDGFFHWCSNGAGSETGGTICLYVPSKGW